MKKEALVWQAIVLIVGLFFVYTIKNYLESKIVIDAMNNITDTRAKAAACYAVAQEKNLNNVYCGNIDTTAYHFLEKTKFEPVKPF